MLKKNQGFTLIELLVVIAIIGILSSVVLASLNKAREKANQASVQSNLKTISVQAELYYDDHSNIYGAAIDRVACPVYAASGASMFVEDRTINNALITAENAGGTGGAFCAVGLGGQTWAVDILFKDSSATWCSDSTGYAGSSTMAHAVAAAAVSCQ